LLLVAAVGKEHDCTVATAAVVSVGTTVTAIGIAGDCPNTAAVEVGAPDPWVGYTPYDTLEEHR
jgi:hypothetical protein